MKILHVKTLKDNRKHILIELGSNESNNIINIKDGGFYKLGYPLDDQIIESHHLKSLISMAWDAYSQQWIEV